jgi:large subunit ribosomal protein L15
MELNNLRPAEGSVKNRKRVGRGQGSGRGGTSTRGHNGAKSRSGYKSKRGFEGGQMPLQMRLPKRGFKNFNRVSYVAMNVGRPQEIADKYNVTEISKEKLVELGIVGANDNVKFLADGELTSKISVKGGKISESAKAKIEAAGGSVITE